MPSRTAKKTKRRSAPKLPNSFSEALSVGYTVHEQLSTWQFRTANKREGFLMLTKGKATSSTLVVPYIALYDLAAPYFLDSKRPDEVRQP
jgi:hypothetical protein